MTATEKAWAQIDAGASPVHSHGFCLTCGDPLRFACSGLLTVKACARCQDKAQLVFVLRCTCAKGAP